MTDKLRVRVYNVRFGDAVLVTIPDRANGQTTTRHILVDFGNVLINGGGEDAVFKPIIEDVLSVLGAASLDLYVMTHEHMDHVQGLLFASKRLGLDLPVQRSWLTASAEPGYYDSHPDAARKKIAALASYRAAVRLLGAAPPGAHTLGPLLFNNNPRSTGDCVEFIRKVAAQPPTYVHRERDIDGTHPFQEAKLEIWAPEEDTSDYYGSFQPLAFAVRSGSGAAGAPALRMPVPPRGVDSGAFYSLVESRRRGVFDNLLAIDRAANNSSIVFTVEWRGWRLLFPGDAEQRSWKEMEKHNVLKPVHFLKVSHHGSWNGTPAGATLEKILPLAPPDGRNRHAAVSTCTGTYNNVPDRETLELLQQRCEVRSVEDAPQQLFFDVDFPG